MLNILLLLQPPPPPTHPTTRRCATRRDNLVSAPELTIDCDQHGAPKQVMRARRPCIRRDAPGPRRGGPASGPLVIVVIFAGEDGVRPPRRGVHGAAAGAVRRARGAPAGGPAHVLGLQRQPRRGVRHVRAGHEREPRRLRGAAPLDGGRARAAAGRVVHLRPRLLGRGLPAAVDVPERGARAHDALRVARGGGRRRGGGARAQPRLRVGRVEARHASERAAERSAPAVAGGGRLRQGRGGRRRDAARRRHRAPARRGDRRARVRPPPAGPHLDRSRPLPVQQHLARARAGGLPGHHAVPPGLPRGRALYGARARGTRAGARTLFARFRRGGRGRHGAPSWSHD